jgi:polar amino acid transport system substrate-binding protein
MDFHDKSKFIWRHGLVLMALFLVAFAGAIWLANQNTTKVRKGELASSTESVCESMRLRLKGNAEYLLMLAKNRAAGSLSTELFQERASLYVREHPEIINITWVDADYFIRDVAPLASNKQIIGLHLDLPEPKRVSQLAKETRRPLYTRPFEAIQGKPSFEFWVPVFQGNTFLGLLGGVYSCEKTLQVLVARQLSQSFHVSLVDAAGRVLCELPKSGHVDEKLVHKASLTPSESGVFLQFGSYGLGRLGWALRVLEFICVALTLGMACAIWVLYSEMNARKKAEEELYQKTVLLKEELEERRLSQEALEVQTAILEKEIEEHMRTEESLRESEARFRVLIEQAPDAIVVYDVDSEHFVDANGSAERLFGCSHKELLLSHPRRFYPAQQPDALNILESFNTHNEKVMQGEQVQFERAVHTSDGRELVCVVHLTKLPDEKRKLIRANYVDITERKRLEHNLHIQAIRLEEELSERQVTQETLQEQATLLEEEVEERRRIEEALKESEATVRNKLKAILEPEGDIGTLELSDIIDPEGLQVMMDDFYKLTGMLGAVLDVSGKVLVAVGWKDICTKFHRCHPETLRHCTESDTELTNGVAPGTFRRYRCKNNMWDMVTPLVVGGRHLGNVFIGQFFYDDEAPDLEQFREQARKYGFDETEYLAALDRVPRFSREQVDAGMQFYAKLAEMVSSLSFSSIKLSRMLADRSHLEEQLRQSQKMEAVGLLAGGVAHDFNNILMVIMGYGNMLKMDNKLDDRQQGKIDQILSAADKAAHLTQGLLAFSRKQILAPTAINLNDIALNVNKFIARIIGEDILLKTTTYGEGLTIYADRGQIEQVLINLATNARDAMPKGGLLTIETGLQIVEAPIDHENGSSEPGRYAVVTVSDTGTGMDEYTSKRLFEPFFTTKEVGKGTGLGMAIVYGIIKQHNGFISVRSETGQGSTFKIYLPIYNVEEAGQRQEIAQEARTQGGTETILLAEDDVDVRNLVVTVLTDFGYQVIQAVDGQDAVEKFVANADKIDLVLMDMIMPKKNGKDAFDEISRIHPGVKVLYSSGYTADFIQNRGVSEEGIELIMKPVQPIELLRKVREVLGSR